MKTPQMATGVGFIILNQTGENGIILDMSANKLMDTAFVGRAEAQIARSSVVMTVHEIQVAAAAHGLELGKKYGVRSILNPAPAARLDDSVLKQVDYLTPTKPNCAFCWVSPPTIPPPPPIWPLDCAGVGWAT